MPEEPSLPGTQPPVSGDDAANEPPKIDLEKLAEKIFALLKRELEIEAQRTGNF